MLRTALLTVAAAVTVVAGTATPAFAKSGTLLSGPRVVAARHVIRLTVWVGDDAGARQASARLQIRDARGKYSWYSPWRRLRIDSGNPDQESFTFTVPAGGRGSETFRAIVTGYATTSAVTVQVR